MDFLSTKIEIRVVGGVDHALLYRADRKTTKTPFVIAGLTRNPLDNAHYAGDCGAEAAMTGDFLTSHDQ
jgi:hypothetical protein